MDNLQFFFAQLVTQADLNQLETNVNASTHEIVGDILGYGWQVTATNPATVVQDTPSADLKLIVNQFLGYDQAGNRLSNVRSLFQNGTNLGAIAAPQKVDMSVDENSATTAVSTVGHEKSISVFVKFARNNYTPRTDGNNATVLYNSDESAELHVVQSAEAAVGMSVLPSLRTDQILLFDTVLTYGQSTITTGQVSYARQQAFNFTLKHGPNHVEGGADAIPNATDSVGALMSHQDKVKLDAITTVSTTVTAGASLPTGTISVVSTTGFSTSGTLLVYSNAGIQTVTYSGGGGGGTSFTGCSGGTGTIVGQVGALTGSAVVQGLPAGIGAQLQFLDAVFPAGTGTTPSATTLVVTSNFTGQAAGGSATKEGVAAFVTAGASAKATIVDPNGNPFVDAKGNRVYGRVTVDSTSAPTAWTLHFYSLIAGVETVYDFTARPGVTLTLYARKFYRLDHYPGLVEADQQAINDAPGVITATKNGASPTVPAPIINVIEGTNVTATVAYNAATNAIDVTINSSASGAFPGFGSGHAADTSGGSGGASGTASRDDHEHQASTIYRHLANSTVAAQANPLPAASVGSLGVSIFAVAAIAGADGAGFAISVGFYTGAGQGSVDKGASGTGTASAIASISGGNVWTASGIGTATISAAVSGTSQPTGGVLLGVGSPF
jgi:hypothetical protein